ncbi:MAG: O-succinylhomoserine sulfhydrylase [Candidatus Kapaibacterium sp.]
MNQPFQFETIAVRTQTERTQYNEHSTPLYLTSSFVFDDAEQMSGAFAGENDATIYSRFSNPNTDEFIQKMCLLEEAEAGFATATGMASVFAACMALLQSGDHILSANAVFGSTHTLFTKYFPSWGITHTYAPIDKPEVWESLIEPNTKIIYCETPSNPGLDIIDLEFLGELAARRGLILVVDNCFATPYLQRPIQFGAHLVIHSATKYIDGQGRTLGGIVVGRKDLIEKIYLFARNSGPSLSPFNAWILSKSLETLALRMERHSENALRIAQYLETHPNIEWVKYPFLPSHPQFSIAQKQMKAGGGIVTFSLKGGIESGRKFLNTVQLCSLTANLGDTRTIVTHPASTTHSKLTPTERLAVGITDGLVRISVGIEHSDDIVRDLSQALESV